MPSKTKQLERDRRAKIEAMRKAEQAKQRRRSIAFLVIAIVVGVGLVAAVVVPSYLERRNDPANRPVADFGVRAAAADCGKVATTPKTNSAELRQHVKVGTTEKYATVPPSYGKHWPSPAYPARAFYTKRDRPPMEQLVHNLEHGYTILWYDSTVTGKQLQALKDISESARAQDAVGPGHKFIVSAWDDAYGKFPAGKHIGLSHWGAQSSHIQLCGAPSGSIVDRFITEYPSTDSPEPTAA